MDTSCQFSALFCCRFTGDLLFYLLIVSPFRVQHTTATWLFVKQITKSKQCFCVLETPTYSCLSSNTITMSAVSAILLNI